ncbi:phosphatidylinositol N-acetylglucosaminyltransferase subunit H [Octodon degus]|uniref:Phosphatidylinositol N-acetylglucosaminyltransferase subunit H n=1 Tax=Octodon degus TaxID=10160 RepID=A0A6P6DAY3_OCTDE|nr:phosphatidylinositol N-acetylglucosaminyltransferase subunit H [Octodon degus]
MEDERVFSDICGGRLALQCRSYSPYCREFCVSCPRLSLRSLTAVTCSVWLAAYGLFALCEVAPGEGTPRPGARGRDGGVSAGTAFCVDLRGGGGFQFGAQPGQPVTEQNPVLKCKKGWRCSSLYRPWVQATQGVSLQSLVTRLIFLQQKVIYYLCILLKDPLEPHNVSQVVPVFQSAKPRLDCLIHVYKSCQEVLAHQKATSTRP